MRASSLSTKSPARWPWTSLIFLKWSMSNIRNDKIARVAARADDLFLERLEQVALHVRLRETVDDRHPVDFFVVLRFDVLAGEVLEDRRADLDAVAVRRACARARSARRCTYVPLVEPSSTAPPVAAALLEVGVPARDRVAFEDDVVFAAATDADAGCVEDEALAEERRLLRVDDDEAVIALRAVVAPSGF